MSKLTSLYDRSRVPLYIQVASVMRQRIDTGFWMEGDKISTLEELEREAAVTLRVCCTFPVPIRMPRRVTDA